MQLSLQKLRWTLIAGAILLVAVLGVYIGYGRYRALRAYRKILAHSGVSLTHDSNGVTWSQSMRNKKLYTIRAKTESSLGEGKYGLRDAELLLYTRSEDHPDRIYGSDMQYDQSAGILRATGEVFMDIQPPQALAGNRHATTSTPLKSSQMSSNRAKASSDQVIHVRTSGLVYIQKMGIASTIQEVNFSYGGMQCQALGADFNSDQSTVRLLANVQMDGYAHGHPLHIVAASADLNRNTNIAKINEPVANSGDRRAKADLAVLHLRTDGSIDHIEGVGNVVLSGETQQVTANRLNATLTPSFTFQVANLSGDVILTDSNVRRPMHGSAQRLDALFDKGGKPTHITATGLAKLSMIDRRQDSHGLARSIEGNQIAVQFADERSKPAPLLQQIHATGSARASGETLTVPPTGSRGAIPERAAVKKIQVASDDLKVLLSADAEGKTQLRNLYGTGRTVLQQDGPLGEQEVSSGDTLVMSFSQDTSKTNGVSVSSAVQAGNVVIRDRAARKPGTSDAGPLVTGAAHRAAFDGATEILTLTGSVRLSGNNASVTAPMIQLDQHTQDADASGGVQTSFDSTSSDQRGGARVDTGPGASAAGSSDPVTHIFSAKAHFAHNTTSATFLGTDAEPAFMWRAGSQIKAASMFFDGIKHTFSATQNEPGDLIHAVFSSAAANTKTGSPPTAAAVIHIASPQMNYDDLNHEAVFSRGVMIDGTMGDVRGRRAIIFLSAARKDPSSGRKAGQSVAVLQAEPSLLNGSIDRVVVCGAVQLMQPGRRASGEQLLYTAATESYLLTGSPSDPPRIVDAERGNVTGKTLLFTNRGSTIVAAGEPPGRNRVGARVRTETKIGTSKEERQ